MKRSRSALSAVVVVALVSACSSEAPTASDLPAEPSGSPGASAPAAGSPSPSRAATSDAAPGAYVSWADYDADRGSHAGNTVVLFFHASWCPDCRATEEALDAEGVPAGLTVVKVDFDTATDLRRAYGVTVQHTFVQLGQDDDPVHKWTGSVSGADIADQLA